MIRGREANSEEENKEKGKSDGSVIVKIPLEGGMIEEMSFGISEEASVWLGDLSTKSKKKTLRSYLRVLFCCYLPFLKFAVVKDHPMGS